MSEAERVEAGALPLFLTMLWVTGLPVFLLFGNRLFPAAPVLKADRLTFVLAAVSMVIGLLRGRQARPRIGRVEQCMAIYLGVVVVSWAMTLPGKTVAGMKQDADFLLTCFVMPFSAFVIARNLHWTAARISRCVWILVAGIGGYLLLFGTIQYAYDWNFLVPESLRDILAERARGPFDNAVPYGIVVSMLVVLAVFLFSRARGRAARAALVVIAAGLVQCVVASKTRAVWIALPIALWLPLIPRPGTRMLAGLLAADLILQLVLAATLGVDRLGVEQRLTQIEPIHDRVALTATASNMITDHPLVGYGFGIFTFQEDKANYYASWGGVSAQSAVYPNNPHNDILNVLILTGVVGLIPFLALMYACWRLLMDSRIRWRQRDPFRSDLASAVHSIFLVLIVAGQFHSVMYMSYPQVLFFFLLGIVAADHDGADQEVGARQYAVAAVPAVRDQPAPRPPLLPAGGDA